MIRVHPETLGRYQLLALLATGGMAEIYLARQTGIQGFNKLVVVKRILQQHSQDSNFMEMFFDEARIAAHLNHPNIVQIFDLGNENGQYFIAMEYLEGESLAYLVSEAKKTGKVMPHQIAAGIVAQICDGLGYAHNLCDETGAPMNIVHRDVNPQNIIVMFSGQVKLVDFGIAKAALQEHSTTAGTLKGKLSYMSPEQCHSHPLKASSDVFSLGVLFWELLTRTRLFRRPSEIDIINAIMSDEIPLVRTHQSDIPPELEAIVDRALQRDPACRFVNAAEMGVALRKVMRARAEETSKEDISIFVEKVFGDRARTKRRLLDEIRQNKGDEIALGLLKPDSAESMPGVVGHLNEPSKDLLTVPLLLDSNSDSISISVTAPRRIPRVAWFILPLVLLIGAAMWWFAAHLIEKQHQVVVLDPLSIAPENNQRLQLKNALPPTDNPGSPNPQGAANTPPEDGAGSVRVANAEILKATLSITSTPSRCKVRVDAVELAGQSPIEKFFVDPEVDHVVDVLCSKYQKETKKFRPRAGEDVRLAFSPAPIKPPPPVATGLLRLNTKPWTEVYLKKKKLGLTPLVDVKLPVGKHTLTLINAERGIEKAIQITIDADKTNNLFVEVQ
jgi:serine/threonine protein kinase